MDQDRIWELLSKQVAGEATPGEQEELEWAFLANPGLRDTLEFIQSIKQTPSPGHSSAEEQQLLDRGLSRFTALSKGDMADMSDGGYEDNASAFPSNPAPVQVSMQFSDQGVIATRVMHTIQPYRWLAAASIAAILAAAALIFHRSGDQRPAPSIVLTAPPKEVVTPRGVRSYADLPDGSKLWLNAGSKIEYVAGFSSSKRELTLFGEAFFDIKHDPDHPFVIHAGNLDIRVLGTSLNVKAYPGDSTLETTLIKGRIEVGLAGDPGSNILLHPSEKVVIRAGVTSLPAHAMAGSYNNISGIALSPQFIRHQVTPDSAYGTIVETSWVENKIVFRNKSLAELAGQLERWYNVKIQFDNNKYNGDRVSGSFKDSPIENIMKALQITTGLHYRISGDSIRIW